MESKRIAHKAQATAESRTLRFVVSDETMDRDGDVIKVAGWDTSEYTKNPVFLFCHNDWDLPIAKAVQIQKDVANKQLVIDFRFPTIQELSSDPDHPSEEVKFADYVFNQYKQGYLSAVSVGCLYLEKSALPGGRFLVTKAQLFEVSAVPIPANPNALRVAGFKKGSATHTDYVKHFQGGETVENKTGATLSKATKDALSGFATKIAKAYDTMKSAHQAMDYAHKDLMNTHAELVKFAASGTEGYRDDTSDGVTTLEPNVGGQDDIEPGKGLDLDLIRKKLTQEG